MIVLVINSGSSSIKFQLLDMTDHRLLCKGLVERIGLPGGIFSYEPLGREKLKTTVTLANHEAGIQLVLKTLTDPKTGVIRSRAEIGAVGHRMVHGGEQITQSELITPEIERQIQENVKLAPLHNPANLMGLHAVRALLPNVPHVAAFDTAFHSTMPEESYIYALDYSMYEKHRIRRFGFHGTSHQYVSRRAAEILGRPLEGFNCITCHMGNGVSITAVRGGRSVDTSLGYGTMCGVCMGTRSGDVDPAVILHLIEELKMSPREVNTLIYKNSGLKGLSGISNDMRDIVQAAEAGNPRARLTLKVFAHGARKYIAALSTNLEGRLDAIVFTAGIGEYGVKARELTCQGLEVLGAKLDPEKNQVMGREAVISTADSRVALMVVPTNEELMIALDTEALAGS